MTRHAKHCRLQVSLVPRQINERDHLRWLLADLHPIQMAMIWFIHHITDTIEAEYIVAHRASASAFNFMLMPEETLSRMATSIVQLTVR